MQKPYTSYNPYFIIPFILWVIVGGILLATYDAEALFRTVNEHHTPLLDVVMYRSTLMGEGLFIGLILLLLLSISRLRNWWYFTAAVVCNILPSIATQIVKSKVNAPRPLKFFTDAAWLHSNPAWPQLMERSFPSGHTCGAFTFFTFLALLLPPGRRAWGIVLFLLGLLVAYSRMYLAVHFFADVYVGSIIGASFTTLIIFFMNRYHALFFRKGK